MTENEAALCEVGMVGLGVMGRNLALNMADKGFSVAGYDRDQGQAEALLREAGGRPARTAATMEELARLLRVPRAIMVLVPAGPPVDAVIEDILPHLVPGDVLMDGGNSFFRQTDEPGKASGGEGRLLYGRGHFRR